MTNDQLLTELIDALRKLNIAASDAAKNHYRARAAELETALRRQLAQAQPLLDAARSYAALVDDGKKMTYSKEYNLGCETSDMQKAALSYARAQAASAAKG